jgi:Ni/Fe-hydrogenase subunit HybB-like protein
MSAASRVITEIKSYPLFVKFLILLVAAAFVAAASRFIFGLGITTNLSDTYPWGLWVAFDVVTSVPLAAGAFVLGAIVHCFHIKKLEPLVRPAIVTGFRTAPRPGAAAQGMARLRLPEFSIPYVRGVDLRYVLHHGRLS